MRLYTLKAHHPTLPLSKCASPKLPRQHHQLKPSVQIRDISYLGHHTCVMVLFLLVSIFPGSPEVMCVFPQDGKGGTFAFSMSYLHF